LTLLIAEGKGPITLEITPAGVDTDKYTVEVDYRKVKFNDEALIPEASIPAAKKPVLPENPSETSYPTGLEIASITQGKSTGIYTVSLSSDDAVGDTTVSDLTSSLSSAVVGDFAAGARWEEDLLEEGVTIATLDLKLDGYSSDLTIKQENPGFVLYEEYFKGGNGGAWDDSEFYYNNDQSLIWSGEGGRILYKQKPYTDENDYGKGDFGGLDFILWGGAKEKVVTFTITYTNSNSVEVTKIIKVDYNDVKF
jgi:hypothetical protein